LLNTNENTTVFILQFFLKLNKAHVRLHLNSVLHKQMACLGRDGVTREVDYICVLLLSSINLPCSFHV